MGLTRKKVIPFMVRLRGWGFNESANATLGHPWVFGAAPKTHFYFDSISAAISKMLSGTLSVRM